MRAIVRLLACCAAVLAGAGMSYAQSASGYPAHTVKIIVPFAPGGPTDVMARLVAQKLSENLGQQFYIENHPGAGGNLGMAAAAKAAPDGYTILFVSSSFVVNPSLYAKNPYDPFNDFAPVTLAAKSPDILVVHPSVPAKTAKEFIDLAKANPGKYSYAVPGIGTTPHLAGELFKLSLGLDMTMVPFPGAGPAIQSIAGGHTPVAFTALPPTASLVIDGQLRGLAVTSDKRSATLPDVPTMAEAGVPWKESATIQGILLPAGTPNDIVALLHREIAKAMASPEVVDRCKTLGFDIVANTPQEFTTYIRAEVERWGKVIKDANIPVIQ
jgi:tripartite-type tricarboxylate transporter receptor subunit TctC